MWKIVEAWDVYWKVKGFTDEFFSLFRSYLGLFLNALTVFLVLGGQVKHFWRWKFLLKTFFRRRFVSNSKRTCRVMSTTISHLLVPKIVRIHPKPRKLYTIRVEAEKWHAWLLFLKSTIKRICFCIELLLATENRSIAIIRSKGNHVCRPKNHENQRKRYPCRQGNVQYLVGSVLWVAKT